MSLFNIAHYEFKMQRRNIAFWLILIVLTGFLFSEVIFSIKESVEIAHSPTPVIHHNVDTDKNITEIKLTALEKKDASFWAGWLFYDRIGLMMLVLMSVLATQVWQRDKNKKMTAMINSRNISAFKYILGKYLGILTAYLFQLSLLLLIAFISFTFISKELFINFNSIEFLLPTFLYLIPSILFSISFLFISSLIVNNSLGAVILHFIYWLYCIGDLSAFEYATKAKFYTYWFFRFDLGFDITSISLLAQKQSMLITHKMIYLSLSSLILLLGTFVYAKKRRN